jgi:uncharacterized membrane protein
MSQRAEQRGHAGEPRLPAACAVILAGALYAALPNHLLIGPRFVVPAFELVQFVPLVAVNPRRMVRENRVLRRLAIALVLVIAAANAVALVLVLNELVSGQAQHGKQLLLAAGQVGVDPMDVISGRLGISSRVGTQTAAYLNRKFCQGWW